MNLDWSFQIIALLHDPPDKALDIVGHERRACRYLETALGFSVQRSDLKDVSDQIASSVERLPMPTAGAKGERAVGPENGAFEIRHPLSGESLVLKAPQIDKEAVSKAVEDICKNLTDPKDRFMALWRMLPEKLAEIHPSYSLMPADTRIPDHTIWHHLDITAGVKSSWSGGKGGAFLSFNIGPVQQFIATARSVRDLWLGSLILSWLTFRGMLPIIDAYGPTAVVYPSLRGIPFLDLWLRNRNGLDSIIPAPPADLKKSPCLPNRFLAVVPWGHDGEAAVDLSNRCRQAALDGWTEISTSVNWALRPSLEPLCQDWDKRWSDQVLGFFDIRTSVLPLAKCTPKTLAQLLAGQDSPDKAFPESAGIKSMFELVPANERPSFDQSTVGLWQERIKLSARLMQAHRQVRHVPPSIRTSGPDEMLPPKCSLMGSYEQMGPDELSGMAAFWENAARDVSLQGVRLRKGERLCSVALIKRFAESFFAEELDIPSQIARFPDTSTIAAAKWLETAGIDPGGELKHGSWSGQWLHWPRRDHDDQEDEVPEALWSKIKKSRENSGPPPAYYAVLAMDGDEIGQWLAGDKSPRVRDVMHPKLVGYYESLGGPAGQGLDARRPVGPALHAAISEALANFSLHVVPEIVKKHSGVLIYSGGDDVLAFLPVSEAVRCARALRTAFRGEYDDESDPGYYRVDGRDLLMMGPKATISAGMALVHHKEDLRQALETARSAEKMAKSSGRDALVITARRRSGQHSTALCPWGYLPTVENWVEAFIKRASDRWSYHLAASAHTLEGLPMDAISSEIGRQVNRAEIDTRKLLGETKDQPGGLIMGEAFVEYSGLLAERSPAATSTLEWGSHLKQFVDLVQTASFMARGRDA